MNQTTICGCIPYNDYIKVNNSDTFKQKDQELKEKMEENEILNEKLKKISQEYEKYNDNLAELQREVNNLQDKKNKLTTETNKQQYWLEELEKIIQKKQEEFEEIKGWLKSASAQKEYMQRRKEEAELQIPEKDQICQLSEQMILKQQIDGTKITWKDLLDSLKMAHSLRLAYLTTKQEKFRLAGGCYSPKREYKLEDIIKRNKIDIVKFENKIINLETDTLEQQDMDKINYAIKSNKINICDNENHPFYELYDPKKKDIVHKANYNLQRMSEYKLALVIPKQD